MLSNSYGESIGRTEFFNETTKTHFIAKDTNNY